MTKGPGTRQPTLADPIWARVFPILRDSIGVGRYYQVKQVAEHLGISSPSVSSWINDKARPTVPNLIGTLTFIGQNPRRLLPEIYTDEPRAILERAVGQLVIETPAQARAIIEASQSIALDSPELATVENARLCIISIVSAGRNANARAPSGEPKLRKKTRKKT